MTRDLFVGLLFLTALGTVLGVSIIVRGVPTGNDAYILDVTFDNVDGLTEGKAVRSRGLEVGRVTNLDYGENGIVAQLTLWEAIPPREGYEFLVKSSSALGGRIVIYDPGVGGETDKSSLVGRSLPDGLDSLGELIDENRERVTSLLANVDEISRAIREGDGALGRAIMDREIGDQFAAIVEDIQKITESASGSDNLLSRIISDPETAEEFDEILDSLGAFAGRLESDNSAIGYLTSEESRQAIERLFGAVNDAVDKYEQDQSVLSWFTRDPKAREQLSGIVTSLAEGPGVFHTLTSNAEVEEEFRRIVTQLDSATYQLSGPYGTVGRLLHSDELYNEVLRVLQLASDGLEDFREQQPINTVIGSIFQALSI